MTNYLMLPIGPDAPRVVNAVIEIPRGRSNKYEYDKSLQVFRVSRSLSSSDHYPGDYGFIPSTLNADNDPLDVLILVDEPSFPGCLIEVCPVGLLEMFDQGVQDAKVLAVGAHNPRYKDVRTCEELPPNLLIEIERFFLTYKELEGKRTETFGWHGSDQAQRVIDESHQRFLKAKRLRRKRTT